MMRARAPRVYYGWYEWQRGGFAPWLRLAQRAAAARGDRWLHAGIELLARSGDAGEPARTDLVRQVEREHRGPVRAVTVAETPFHRLRRFHSGCDPRRPRVLLVAPFSGYATGMLAEFVAALLPAANVLVTDWTDARLVPRAAGRFDLDAQALAVLDALRTHGGPTARLHVVGVSQGVVPALAAVALAAAGGGGGGPVAPRSLSLLGGPVDPRRDPTPLDRVLALTPPALVEAHLLSVVPPRFPGRGRVVYPGLLQLIAYAAHNAGLYLHAQAGLLAELAAGRPDGYARLHAELHGVADVPGELFAQGLRTVYRDAALARGTWSIRGRPVEPGRIGGGRTGLLTVEAGRDELVGAGQTHAAHDLCPAVPGTRRVRLTLPGAGHVDLFRGPAFRTRLLPRLLRFIAVSDAAAA